MKTRSLGEFDLIQRFFAPLQNPCPFVQLGQGDDCAVFAPSQGFQCVVSTDTLVSGVHFLPDMAPDALGHRVLAVSLSDLAAMGAHARACTLAITLPQMNLQWLEAFSQGFGLLARDAGVTLMGGDTTRGPLSITVTVFGEVPEHEAILRSAASQGEALWVSGQLGAAWLGLMVSVPDQAPSWLSSLDQVSSQAAMNAFEKPQPRLKLGRELQGLATSAIDLSDGLASDAQHVAAASKVTLHINLDALPVSPLLLSATEQKSLAIKAAVTAGDDYELLFTTPLQHSQAIDALSQRLSVPLTRIGTVEPQGPGKVVYLSEDEATRTLIASEKWSGFDHFYD